MEKIIKGKPDAFFESFDRKESKDKVTTHYCPGCGHGRIHKLIAEAVSDLKLGDRSIFVSPVGCSVFGYYYMKMGNVQAAHGRAPAVATGLIRSNPDSIVLSYQGDGDLGAIGTAEVIHAANRGENMTVIFVNNAIYGMTGGQMAPTTMIGQKTLTTPRGRTVANEGYPIRMAELIATLEAPVYVERVTCTDFKNIMKTRKAIRKALQLQADRKGFSFVEILSACPTGWKKNPVDSIKWMQEVMEPYFKPGVYKDKTGEAQPLPKPEMVESADEIIKILGLERGKTPSAQGKGIGERKIKIAGFGGQGALTAGVALATAGMHDGLHVSWLPSYGPEMRGGTANCSVIVSDKRVASPLIVNPDVLVAMNGPSLDAFEDDVTKGGLIIVNSSIVTRKVRRTDVRAVYVPLTEIATELGLKAVANMVAVGAVLKHEKLFAKERMHDTLKTSLKKKETYDINVKAVNAGFDRA